MIPRSVNELANDPTMDNMLIKWTCIGVENEPIIILAIPASKRHVWIYKHITTVIRNFADIRIDYYMCNTSHRTKIDLTQAIHKDLKTLLRKMHKHYPVEFGYSLKAPCDMHSNDMAKRVALERLIKKIKGAV